MKIHTRKSYFDAKQIIVKLFSIISLAPKFQYPVTHLLILKFFTIIIYFIIPVPRFQVPESGHYNISLQCFIQKCSLIKCIYEIPRKSVYG